MLSFIVFIKIMNLIDVLYLILYYIFIIAIVFYLVYYFGIMLVHISPVSEIPKIVQKIIYIRV